VSSSQEGAGGSRKDEVSGRLADDVSVLSSQLVDQQKTGSDQERMRSVGDWHVGVSSSLQCPDIVGSATASTSTAKFCSAYKSSLKPTRVVQWLSHFDAMCSRV